MEAGAFRARIGNFKKSSCETPLLPSSIHKKQLCHPERSEGSHSLYINWLMYAVISSEANNRVLRQADELTEGNLLLFIGHH